MKSIIISEKLTFMHLKAWLWLIILIQNNLTKIRKYLNSEGRFVISFLSDGQCQIFHQAHVLFLPQQKWWASSKNENFGIEIKPSSTIMGSVSRVVLHYLLKMNFYSLMELNLGHWFNRKRARARTQTHTTTTKKKILTFKLPGTRSYFRSIFDILAQFLISYRRT